MSAMIDGKVENAGSDVILRSQWQDLVGNLLILDRCHFIDTCRHSVNSERKLLFYWCLFLILEFSFIMANFFSAFVCMQPGLCFVPFA